MFKSYKIRLYPTKEQELLFYEHINASRYIWNYMIEQHKKEYEETGKHLSGFDMCKLITPLKNDGNHDWLRRVSVKTLQKACKNLESAYIGFYKKNKGYPKFKSKKKDRKSFMTDTEHFYFVDKKYLFLPKIGKVKYKTDYNVPLNTRKFSNVTVFLDINKWFVTASFECEKQVLAGDFTMGIDLGIKDLAIVAFNDKKIVYHNINKSSKIKKIEKRIAYYNRSMSRKYVCSMSNHGYYKVSNNMKKEIIKIQKQYKRLRDIRTNYIHQVTKSLVNLYPSAIIMEDLDIVGLLKNKRMSKMILNQCFYKFITFIKYKCDNNGIDFIQVPTNFPSSKMCSNCGNIKKELKLSNRIYYCDVCGSIIDRDYNAAINLMKYQYN